MHPFCKLLSSFLNACKGLFLGIFGISTQLLFWSETIDVAEENHLILRWHFRHKQIHSQDILTEASLQSKAVAGDVAMHAALCSASWCCFKVAAHWPNASSTRWGTVFGAHTHSRWDVTLFAYTYCAQTAHYWHCRSTSSCGRHSIASQKAVMKVGQTLSLPGAIL